MLRLKLALVLSSVVFVLDGEPASADGAVTVNQLLKSGETVLGQRLGYRTDAPLEVRSSIVVLEPGGELPEHRHPVPIYGYVLEGAVTVHYETGETRVYTAGEALLEAVNVWHSGRNDGAVPVRILVVGMGIEGIPDSIAR